MVGFGKGYVTMQRLYEVTLFCFLSTPQGDRCDDSMYVRVNY